MRGGMLLMPFQAGLPLCPPAKAMSHVSRYRDLQLWVENEVQGCFGQLGPSCPSPALDWGAGCS